MTIIDEFGALAAQLWAWPVALLVLALGLSPLRDRARLFLLLAALLLLSYYLFWRSTATLNLDDPASAIIGIGLLLAEFYVFINFCLAAFQMWSPTQKKTPPDVTMRGRWPSVDVYITVYNEPLDVLRRTAIACKGMDYPGPMTVWILDDGHRKEAHHLATQLKCRYLSRPDNTHAKAGNLNYALARTKANFVAIFDVDHMPVSTFLKETVPYLLADEGLAFVQTPHHFYNPDPFQRNLAWEQAVSNEQDFYYRVILPGRDHWNAAFFCGSSGVFRRSALDDIGGFRTETVTEDIHTSITLHAKGWRSLVHDRVLAAGLAPETLRDFVQQRHRWAKGTFQMARKDNPLTLKGLTLPQRLNYFASVWYFLFPLARMWFLIAPLSFLLAEVQPLQTSFGAMSNHYGPYVLAMLIAYPVVSKRYKGLVESDLVEFASSFALLSAISSGFLGHKAGIFKVTPKNRTQERRQWDLIGLPHAILFAVSIVAIAWAWLRLGTGSGMLAVNTIWGVYNAFLMLVIVITANQRPQVRKHIRFQRSFPVTASDATGTWSGRTLDIAEHGLRVSFKGEYAPQSPISLIVSGPKTSLEQKGNVVWAEPVGQTGIQVGIELLEPTPQQSASLIRLVTEDPDSWERQSLPPPAETPKILALLLAPLRLGYREEARKRQQPRTSGRLHAGVIINGRIHQGRILDISPSGMRIRCHGRIPAVRNADRLQVSIEPTGNQALVGNVRWVRRHWFSTEIGLHMDQSGAYRALSQQHQIRVRPVRPAHNAPA